MNATPKCSDIIADKMKEREEELEALSALEENGEVLDEFALSVETDKMTTVTLSWGGPADYLEILWHGHSLAWEIKRVVYRYSDWFDTATIEVEEGSRLWEYAHMIIETQG